MDFATDFANTHGFTITEDHERDGGIIMTKGAIALRVLEAGKVDSRPSPLIVTATIPDVGERNAVSRDHRGAMTHVLQGVHDAGVADCAAMIESIGTKSPTNV